MNKRHVFLLLAACLGVCICVRAQERYTVHVVDGGSLTVTNNIIICNEDTCINVPTTQNLTTNSYKVFADFVFDFRLAAQSPAKNVGANSVNPLGSDMAGKPRVMETTIDYGAFEALDTEHSNHGIVHKTPGGALKLYNNIIINNFENLPNVSDLVTGDHNFTTDATNVFVDERLDFSLAKNAPTINVGTNQQSPQTTDLKGKPRVMVQTVDLGAFEYPDDEHGKLYVVHQTIGGTLALYNNIIINNDPDEQHVNVPNSGSHNLLSATGAVFKEEFKNFTLAASSPAINAGDNSYATQLHDLKQTSRIMDGTVDMGAFETRDSAHSTLYAIHQTGHGTLQVHNNISILNLDGMLNVDDLVSGSHNLTEDTSGVFVNDTLDFQLADSSPAANVGDNQYMTLPTDIADGERIPCDGIVDLGAFEIQPDVHTLSLTATTVSNDNCSGNITILTASGGETYQWSHSNETTGSVTVNPIVQTCYTVTATWDGICPWADTATICIDPNDVVENAQGSPSTSGREFWVSYMRNYKNPPKLTLLVSSQTDCSGSITNPNTGWSTTFQVAANQTTLVAIPNAQAYCNTPGEVTNYGLYVTATEDISLYASNFEDFTYDVTNILPVPALANEYITQSYTPMMNTEFLIVATADSTTVEIFPSQNTSDGHLAYTSYTVTLNQGQTYLVLSDHGGVTGDLSGSRVRSTDPQKPLAVFSGNVCANIPVGYTWCDHIVEQAFGTQFWGRRFVITNTLGMPYDRVKITAAQDNTIITKDGEYLATLQANNSYEFQIDTANPVCFLETSNACATYLYIPGGLPNVNDDYRGDPSMVWISPVEQRIQEITFSTFYSPNITQHSINVVIPTSAEAAITLDGVSILGQFHPVPSNPMFSYARLHIPHGTHTLASSHGLVAHVYGTGHCESYAYSVGSKAEVLSQQLYVNHILSTELEDNNFCSYEEITFDASVNYPCDSVVWNFGDSYDNQHGMHLTHHYTSAGTYTVSMTVFMSDEYGVHCSTTYAQLVLHEGYNIVYTDTVCQGEHYTLHGFDYTADTIGPVTVTRSVDIPDSDCDSTYVLELMVLQQVFPFYDTICAGNDYHGHGFDLTSPAQGYHLLTHTTQRTPCDSITELHLLVTPNINDMYGIHGLENICVGNTYEYFIDTLSGLNDITWTVPEGAFIQSGQGSDQITVYFSENVTDGFITLSGANSCGDASFTLAIHPQPVYYIQITDTVCGAGQPYHGYGFDIDSVQKEYTVFIHSYVSQTCCDSTVTLTLLVVDMPEVTLLADTNLQCQGESVTLTACCLQDNLFWYDTLSGTSPLYEWNTGDTTVSAIVTLDTTTTYQLFVHNDYGCVIEADTTLFVAPTYHISDTVTLCEGQLPYTYHDTTFAVGSASGQYFWQRQSAYGCDSVVNLHLIINHGTHNVQTETVCESYLWHGTTYTQSGTYTYSYNNANGCASTDTLHLTVRYGTHNVETETVCESYVWHGTTYTQSGVYTYSYTNSNGCPSVDTLYLTVHYGTHNVETESACESFVWHGTTHTQSGTYTYSYTNSNGCASVDTLKLTIHNPVHQSSIVTAYNTYVWTSGDGNTYTTSGDYTYTHADANGCTQVDTLHLTIHYSITIDTSDIACDSYEWDGMVYTQSGDYTRQYTNIYGADSIVNLHLTVNYGTYDVGNETACESFVWHGTTYSQSGIYIYPYTNDIGCPSADTLHLTVHYGTHNVFNETACESYVWHGTTYTQSGTYTYPYTNANGCASVDTLHLTVHYGSHTNQTVTACENYVWNGITFLQSGIYTYNYTNGYGCPSVDTLFLTILHGSHNVQTETVCESYVWHGTTYTQSGIYTYSYNNANGCASVDTLHLTVHYGTHNVQTETACESYVWHGQTYITSGTYTYAYTNANGCASVDTLHLTVHYGTHNAFNETVCESYVWHGTTYTQPGVYTYSYNNADGCASVDTLHLTVHYGTHNVFIETACESYVWHGTTYTQSGVYTYSYNNADGCASVDTLHLTVHYGTHNVFNETACESYVWHGTTYTQSGTYTYAYTNSNGCASVDTLLLAVHHGTHNVFIETACESYLWHGVTYTLSGTYTYPYTNANGCPSLDTLYLTVHHGTHDVFYETACESFLWHGTMYTLSGTYSYSYTNANGCASADTLHLTLHHGTHNAQHETACESYAWHGTLYTASGTYTYSYDNANGCASVDTLYLTILHGSHNVQYETACESFLWHGVTYTLSGTYTYSYTGVNGCPSMDTLHLTVVEPPVLTEIRGDSLICRNQFATYHYNTSDNSYYYRWFWKNMLLAENRPSVTLHEMVSGTSLLTMQVTDLESICLSETSLPVTVSEHYAPDTTIIRHKTNSNILVCKQVHCEYGDVHYRWGYTNRNTLEEAVVEDGNYNYTQYQIGIDTLTYYYWVETYITYPDGQSCANRTYYGNDYLTSTESFDHDVVEAYIYGDRIVILVNTAVPSEVNAALYNVNGKLLLTRGYHFTDQVTDFLQLSAANGVYFLKITTGDRVHTFKLVKM